MKWVTCHLDELLKCFLYSLHDRLCGKVHCGSKPGPTPYLSYDEEEELTSFLIQTSKIGYPHTKAQLLYRELLRVKGLKQLCLMVGGKDIRRGIQS